MLFSQRKGKTPQLPEAASATNILHGEPVELDWASLHEVQATLRVQQERLHQLAGSTECEFLAIGARLQVSSLCSQMEEIPSEIGRLSVRPCSSVTVRNPMSGNSR